MLAIGLFMHALEALALLEADPARPGRFDEAHCANKKYAPLEDPFPLDALQFVRQGFRSGIAQKGGKGGRAYRRAVVELDDVRRSDGADLSDPLQIDDAIDECGVGPGLGDAIGLLERDHVGCGLLDDTESFALQLSQDSGLSRARRTGQDEPFHPESLNLTAIGEFPQFPQALCQSFVVMDFSDNTTFRPLIGVRAISPQPSSSHAAHYHSSLRAADR